MSSSFFVNRAMFIYKQKQLHAISDPVVIEVPLTIILNGIELTTMACSPDAYQELAIGFLLSEGILQKESTINSIILEEQTVKIEAHPVIIPEMQSKSRFINTCSGRGYRNRTMDEKHPISYKQQFYAEDLLKLIQKLDETSFTFKRTGGVHSAALGGNSELIIRYEDIGRHNAVDKVFGNAFLNGICLDDKCLVLSGRIACEILVKALRNEVPLVLSRSAPTLAAVELAEQYGMTIVGFARGDRFNVYTHSERIICNT